MQTVERLNSLMEHLRLEAAFFATQIPGDVADLASKLPGRMKGLVLCAPTRFDARPLEHVGRGLLMISGETGLSAEMTRRARERFPGRSDIFSWDTTPRAGRTSSPTGQRRLPP